MTVRLEWIPADETRPELVGRSQLEAWSIDGDEAGDAGMVVHSGAGDGAVIYGDPIHIADYLSEAARQLNEHAGARLQPTVYADTVNEVLNTAADDVLERLAAAGITVEPSMRSLIDILVNVTTHRLGNSLCTPVDEALQAGWPDEEIDTVLWWCVS